MSGLTLALLPVAEPCSALAACAGAGAAKAPGRTPALGRTGFCGMAGWTPSIASQCAAHPTPAPRSGMTRDGSVSRSISTSLSTCIGPLGVCTRLKEGDASAEVDEWPRDGDRKP